MADSLRATGSGVAGAADTLLTTDVSFSDSDGNTVTLTAPRVADQADAEVLRTAIQSWIQTNLP